MVKRRAFIVAVETYGAMQEGLSATLPGTHAAAVAFRRWLIEQHTLSPTDIYFCTEDAAVEGRTAGATCAEIIDELARLKDDGKDRTDELYVLYIGHGLCYRDVDGVRLADVLLAADYRRREVSGNACLRIDEIQAWLRLCMGPSDHYYFIDACRNDVGQRDIKVGTLGLAYDNSSLGAPTVYTLYSVVEGTVAAADSGFVAVLVEALNGSGRAKVWYRGGMAVLFRSVKDYVEGRLAGQDVDQRVEGRRDGLIRLIAPTPDFACTIDVANAAPADAFVLTVTDSRQAVVATLPFTGAAAMFRRPPDDYMLSVSIAGAAVEPIDPLPADLYDDRTIRFVKRAPVAGGAPAAPAPADDAPMVSIVAPPHLRVELRNLQTGASTGGGGGFAGRLAPGSYSMKTFDAVRGVTFGRERVEVGGGAPIELDLRDRGVGDLHQAWLPHFGPAVRAAGGFDFSETLGPTGDTGMDLWLALFGSSRVVADPNDFSPLGALPLATFDDVKPDESRLYFLAAVEPAPDRIALELSGGGDRAMHLIAPHPTLPGVFERQLAAAAGCHGVALRIGTKEPIGVGAYLLPNCATLLTATTDNAGALRLQQLVLPIRHLAERLSRSVRACFSYAPLGSVRQMVEVQRRFAASRDLGPALSDERLDDLIALEWFEPITAILLGYDLVRRGDAGRLRRLVPAMRTVIDGAPDVEALAKVAGLPWRMPAMPPLVLDGLLSLNMAVERSPLDGSRLDFRGPWATWTGGVAAHGGLTGPIAEAAG